jgi:hypothetical protein
MKEINLEDLTELEQIESTLKLCNEAKLYLTSFSWCIKIKQSWYAKGLYEKVGVFLFNIEPVDSEVDDFIWVITGDLPSVYLDKSVPNADEALITYCNLMEDWSNCVLTDNPLQDCYPVDANPTIENAQLLKLRIDFIRQNLLS